MKKNEINTTAATTETPAAVNLPTMADTAKADAHHAEAPDVVRVPVTAEGTIKGRRYDIIVTTTRKLADLLDNLPSVQTVRGRVWPQEVSDGLINDLKEGKYIPPLVIVADPSAEDPIADAALTDGQQRANAIRDAVRDGRLTGEEQVVVAIDYGRTVEDSFAVLNIGVPVGSSLVTAMRLSGDVGQAVVDVASHPYFSGVKWSALQVKRTAKADFATAILAMCSGWDKPESSAKECAAWLEKHQDNVTTGAVEKARAFLDELNAAMEPFTEQAKAKGSDGKHARSILAAFRKKNLWMTAIGAWLDRMDDDGNERYTVADIVAVMGRDDLLQPYTYKVPMGKGKKTKEVTAEWTGAGSSGSNSNYCDRAIVFAHAMDVYMDGAKETPKQAELNAARSLGSESEADTRAALGL